MLVVEGVLRIGSSENRVAGADVRDGRRARVYRSTLIGSWTTRGMYTVAASYGLDYQQGDIRRRLDDRPAELDR